MRRVLLAGLMAAGVIVIPVSGAAAQEQYPVCDFTATITAARVAGGILVNGSNFEEPFTKIDVTVQGLPPVAVEGTSFSVTIPGTAPPNATVTAKAAAPGNSRSCQAITQLDAPPPPPPPRQPPPPIAFTGGDTQLAWIGLACLTIGIALVVGARRLTGVRKRRSKVYAVSISDSVEPALSFDAFVRLTPQPRQITIGFAVPAGAAATSLLTADDALSPEHLSPEVAALESQFQLVAYDPEAPICEPEPPKPLASAISKFESIFQNSLRDLRATFAKWIDEDTPKVTTKVDA